MTSVSQPSVGQGASPAVAAGAESEEAFNWKSHVKILERRGTNFSFTCNYCAHPKPMTGGSSRFKDHLLGQKGVRKCLHAPEKLIESLRLDSEHRNLLRGAAVERSSSMATARKQERSQELSDLRESLLSGSAHVNKKWRQTTVEECDGAALLDQTQRDVARMWYRCALPFSMVSYTEVVNAFDAVCSYGARTGQHTFAMPSAPSLRNSRLDAEVSRIEQELALHAQSMAAYGISLQSDGKDNMARRHLVNILTTSPAGAQFRETVDVSGQLRDAEHTAQVLVDAVGRLPEAERNNVVSIITDTPAVNRKAWTIIEQTCPSIQCIPCGAHCVNLHFKHIARDIPEFNQMIDNCKRVVYRLVVDMHSCISTWNEVLCAGLLTQTLLGRC